MKLYEEKQAERKRQEEQRRIEQEEKRKKTQNRVEKKRRIGMKTTRGQPLMKFKIKDMLDTIKSKYSS